jgi:molecular chaperone Hsp33
MEFSGNGSALAGVEVRTFFVRYRNFLLAEADFTGLYVDYYLHLVDHGLQIGPEFDDLFKKGLAAFTLHCASRPRNEMTAWTINFQDPLVNLFLAGDNNPSTVTGRVFSEDVREADQGLFYSDVVRGGAPVHRSSISFATSDPFEVVHRYYEQSEQRLARYLHAGGDRHLLFTSHPDCDLDWFREADDQTLISLADHETLAPIEKRQYAWFCGCSQRKILKILAPTMKVDPDGLFAGDDSLRLNCPRCGARHLVTREALEAYVATE